MSRKSFLAIAAALAVVVVLLAVSGGVRVTVGGLRISARSPLVPSAIALASLAAWWAMARRARGVGADLDDAWLMLDRHGPVIVGGIAMASAIASVRFATFTAAGADASGYLSQAALWASGRLALPDTLSSLAGWPANPALTVPLGWRPGLLPGWQVPTYGPGLPLLMALPHALRGTFAACLIVSISTGVAVWCTGTLATRMAGGAAGAMAALLLAVSPVFLFQSVQPMSDVPVTAAWMACWAMLVGSRESGVGRRESGVGSRETAVGSRETAVGRRETGVVGPHFSAACVLSAGAACAVAVLIRPNLAPLAAVPFAALVFARRSHLAPILFAVPVGLAALFLAWLQWHWYGSPLRSGYGTAEELFAFGNVARNASRYAQWLLSTAPALVLAPIGLMVSRRPALARPLAAFAALNVAAYLAYFVFDDWSYLRFLLPALAASAVLAGVLIVEGLSRAPVSLRAAVWLALALAIAAHGLSQARARDAFDLANQHQRVAQLGGHLRTALPESAVIVTGEQSGSLRYYTGRPIVRWDDATPAELTQALGALRADGRDVWIALDAWEEPLYREKFAGMPAGALDWPPVVEAGDTHRTRAWRLSDRERFLGGARVTTDRLR